MKAVAHVFEELLDSEGKKLTAGGHRTVEKMCHGKKCAHPQGVQIDKLSRQMFGRLNG